MREEFLLLKGEFGVGFEAETLELKIMKNLHLLSFLMKTDFELPL